MKKFFKIFFITIITLIFLVIILFAVYSVWIKSVSISPLSLIDKNFLIYANLNDPVDSLKRLNESQLIETMRTEASFRAFYQNFERIRSLVFSQSSLLRNIASVETHAVYYTDNSFIVIFDLGLRSIFANLGFKAFKTFIADKNEFSFSSLDYRGYAVNEIIELANKSKFYFVQTKNLFIASQNLKRLQLSIDVYINNQGINNNDAFERLKKFSYSGDIINIYSNTSVLTQNIFQTSPLIQRIVNLIDPKLMSFNFKDATRKDIELSAYQENIVKDEAVKRFFMTQGRKTRADIILPHDTSNYVGITFSEFKDVWNFLKAIFKNDQETLSYFAMAENKIKEFTNMTLEQWLFSWIKNEIGLGMLKDQDDPFIVIHSSSPEKALKHIEALNVAIISTRPDTFEYKGHKVNQIALPPGLLGLARLFVPGLRLPYYTVIEDLIIMSQSRRVISEIIDAYKSEKVLKFDKRFKNLIKKVDYEGNIIAYWDLQKKNFGLLAQDNFISKLIKSYNQGILTVNFENNIISQKIYVSGREQKVIDLVKPFPINVKSIIHHKPIFYDIDDDGVKEIIFSEESGQIHVLSSTGIPKYAWADKRTKSKLYSNIHVFNNRRDVYLCAVDYDGNIFLWNHKGELLSEFLDKKIEGKVRANIATGDVNNDGFIDIVIATEQGKLYVIDSNGNFIENFPVELNRGIYLTPIITDFTGNGKNEIIIAPRSFSGEIFVIDCNGKILNDYIKKTGFLINANLIAHDFNDDGNIEIIALARNGKIFIFNKNGDLTNFPIDTGEIITNNAKVIKTETGEALAVLLNNGKILLINSKGEIFRILETNKTPSPNTPLDIFKIKGKDIFAFGGNDKNLVLITMDGKKPQYPNIFGSNGAVIDDMNNDSYLEVLTAAYDRRVYLYKLFK